jgi:prepilin-type N-terminal cleavage/methylation domain-containing protein
MSRWSRELAGFTLLELLMAVALLGLLTVLGGGVLLNVLRGWQLRKAANDLLEEVRYAQNLAARQGDYARDGGQFVETRTFFHFDVEAGSYRVDRWIDANPGNPAKTNNGRPDPGDRVEPLLDWQRLPAGIAFGTAEPARAACGDSGELRPDRTVTISPGSDPPCSGRPCLRLNRLGFSETGPGAIYLTDGSHSYGLRMLRSGYLELCRHVDGRWRP